VATWISSVDHFGALKKKQNAGGWLLASFNFDESLIAYSSDEGARMHIWARPLTGERFKKALQKMISMQSEITLLDGGNNHAL
jgi:hypothetical protein